MPAISLLVGCKKAANQSKVKLQSFYRASIFVRVWFNFYFGLKFSNQFNFYFPLSQIMVMNLKQKKIKIKMVSKFQTKKN